MTTDSAGRTRGILLRPPPVVNQNGRIDTTVPRAACGKATPACPIGGRRRLIRDGRAGILSGVIRFLRHDRARGVLYPAEGARKMKLFRVLPPRELAPFVEHFWIVEWDLLPGESYRQYTIPQPCVHVVVAPGMSGVFGVMSGLFSYLMTEKGRVLGIKFTPGGFRPVGGGPVSRLSDRRLSIEEVFGPTGRRYEAAVEAADGGPDELAGLAAGYLRELNPRADEQSEMVRTITSRIESDREIRRVGDLAVAFGIGARTLQRVFREYVGVGPKWVIMRYRLLEAAERLAAGERVDTVTLAQELGYFDQAHFIGDFKRLIGTTPSEYAKAAGESPRLPVDEVRKREEPPG